MNQKDIHDLIKLINKTDISEFRMKDKDFSILIRSNDYVKNSGTTIVSAAPQVAAPVVASTPVPAVSAPTEVQKEATASTDESKYITFKSPIVGTFTKASLSGEGFL